MYISFLLFYSDTLKIFDRFKRYKKSEAYLSMEKKEPPVSNLPEIDPFSQPLENVNKWTPLTYFRKFRSDVITERLIDQKNLCSVEKTGELIKTLRNKWKDLLVFKC